MLFPEWFKSVYQRPQEGLFNAIHRFAFESGLGWTTVMRAVKGTRVQVGSAKVLASKTGGEVSEESLRKAPTRKEQREHAQPDVGPGAEGEPAAEAS